MARRRRTGRVQGIAARKQRLTVEDVQYIKTVFAIERRMRKPGAVLCSWGMYPRLAKKFGVSRRTIKAIHRGERWRSVKVKVRRNRMWHG